MPKKTPLQAIDTDGEHVKCSEQAGGCEMSDLFRLLGKSHMLDVLHLFIVQEPGRTVRFVEVQHTLKLSPNTLSERLRELTQAGLLTREAHNEIPPRVDYQATQKARELEPVFLSLVEWARKNNLQAQPATRPATASASG